MNKILALTLCLFSGLAFGASRFKTDQIVAEDGGAVSFPSGFTVPTSNGELVASSYSATLVASTNVAAVVTPVTLKYSRYGIYVNVWGQVSIDPTSATTLSTFTLTTPILRASNFSGTSGAAGTAGLPAAVASGVCSATNSAKTISCTYTSGGTAVELVNVNFWYTTTGD